MEKFRIFDKDMNDITDCDTLYIIDDPFKNKEYKLNFLPNDTLTKGHRKIIVSCRKVDYENYHTYLAINDNMGSFFAMLPHTSLADGNVKLDCIVKDLPIVHIDALGQTIKDNSQVYLCANPQKITNSDVNPYELLKGYNFPHFDSVAPRLDNDVWQILKETYYETNEKGNQRIYNYVFADVLPNELLEINEIKLNKINEQNKKCNDFIKKLQISKDD